MPAGCGGASTLRGVSRTQLLLLAVLVPAVIVHEVSHGVVALAFGDDTAKRAGRLTLNPVRHIDPFGSVLLPILLVLAGAPPFGYAKPVPVDPRRMRRPRDQSMLTSLAGPALNVVLAVLAGLAVPLLEGWPQQVVFAFGLINVVLAAFNLIPVPPLDGSAVVERFLPRRWLPAWAKLRQWSMGILLLLVLALPGALDTVFGTAIDLWRDLFL